MLPIQNNLVEMLKILFILLCLTWIKSIISVSATEIKTGLPTVTDELSKNKCDAKKNEEKDESILSLSNDEIPKDAQSEIQSNIIPVENLLDMVQIEMNESEDIDKTHYIDFLTSLDELLNGNAQRVKVFFKNVWRNVDLGVLGSARRLRNAKEARGLLQSLKDLWSWLCRRIIGLTTWFKPDGSEKEIEKLNKLEHEEKLKYLEAHSKEREEFYGTATPEKSEKKIDDSGAKRYSS